jgi:hypothetical protein
MPEQVSPIKISLAPMAPEIEAQLFNSFLRPITANVLRKMYDYLAENTRKDSSEELAACLPLVGAAVQTFQAEDYMQAFQRTYLAYRYLLALRTQRPELPALELESESNGQRGGPDA